jgi:hypothetical protein
LLLFSCSDAFFSSSKVGRSRNFLTRHFREVDAARHYNWLRRRRWQQNRRAALGYCYSHRGQTMSEVHLIGWTLLTRNQYSWPFFLLIFF